MTRRGQADLFAETELFPVRRPVQSNRPVDLSLRIKTAMGEALKACPDSATVIAARMSEMTGREITADALYAYTAASKPDHDIGIVRFVAFTRATGANWLWDLLVEDDGLVVLEGRAALLAQLGHIKQEQGRLTTEMRRLEKELRQEPVRVRHRSSPR